MEEKIIKYPRTKHLEGSRLQKGDEDLSQVPFSFIKNKFIVIEEKIDGANVAISFSKNKELLLQSRGHFFRGGYKERHYELFKTWANFYKDELYKILGEKYIMYGEWMYAKHKIYYDKLPHYFIEFDIYDKENNVFLSTSKGKEILKNTNIISVPVLKEGKFSFLDEVLSYLKESHYISLSYLESLKKTIKELKLDEEKILSETDRTNLMEGLYIKVENDDIVLDRMKYVSHRYIQVKIDEDSSWFNKEIIPNKLDKDISELFK